MGVGNVPGVLNSYGMFNVLAETACANFVALIAQSVFELGGFEDVAAAPWERIKEGLE